MEVSGSGVTATVKGCSFSGWSANNGAGIYLELKYSISETRSNYEQYSYSYGAYYYRYTTTFTPAGSATSSDCSYIHVDSFLLLWVF